MYVVTQFSARKKYSFNEVLKKIVNKTVSRSDVASGSYRSGILIQQVWGEVWDSVFWFVYLVVDFPGDSNPPVLGTIEPVLYFSVFSEHTKLLGIWITCRF